MKQSKSNMQNNRWGWWCFIAFCWCGTSCQSHYTLNVISSGIFDCFEAQGEDVDKVIYCETSAVAFDGERLYLASDKKIPDGSPVFDMPLEGNRLDTDNLEYWEYAPFEGVKKYEDFSRSPDGKRFFAMTSFDRLKEEDSEWDAYNMLLSWTIGMEKEEVQVVAASERDNITSSRVIKSSIKEALETYQPDFKADYFKLEGCAAMPNNKLLFGVREAGVHYDDFSYKILLLEVSYNINTNNEVVLNDDWKVVYEYDSNVEHLGITSPVGLSSIEYDPTSKSLYLLTSYELGEKDTDRGAYLWVLPTNYIKTQKAPILVQDEKTNKPFTFAHKAEGVAILSEGELFIIHDDDKVLGGTKFEREPHQAAYDIVTLKKTKKK